METLHVDRSANGVVTLTLDRPEKKNAMNMAMFNELLAVFREVNDSLVDRVLVITGAGDAFCSGADLGDRGNDTRPPVAPPRCAPHSARAPPHTPNPHRAEQRRGGARAPLHVALRCSLR